MPTRKQLLQTKIDTNLESGTSITAAEHRDVETSIMNAAIPVNRGGFFLGNVIGPTGDLEKYGDLTYANATTNNGTCITVHFTTSMITTNYVIKIYMQGSGTNGYDDAWVLCPIFKILSTTVAEIWIREPSNSTQSLRFHLEVVSLDY